MPIYISGGQPGQLYSQWRHHNGQGGLSGAQPTLVWPSLHGTPRTVHRQTQCKLVEDEPQEQCGNVDKFWQYCTNIDERQQCSTNTSSLPPCHMTQPFLISLGVCLHSSQLTCHCEIPWHFHDSSRHTYPCCIITSCTTVLSLLPVQYKYWCIFYKNVHVHSDVVSSKLLKDDMQ